MFSKKDFEASNKNVNVFDYIQALFTLKKISADLISAVESIFRPKLIKIERALFIEELYSKDKHQDLTVHYAKADEVTYWMNLIELTTVFDGVDYESVLLIAKALKANWVSVLANDYRDYDAEVLLIEEKELREIYLTIRSQ